MKTENTIKMLEDVKKNVTDPRLKKELESKIDKLSNNKPINK